VATVHAVEVANRQCACRGNARVLKTAENLHGVLSFW